VKAKTKAPHLKVLPFACDGRMTPEQEERFHTACREVAKLFNYHQMFPLGFYVCFEYPCSRHKTFIHQATMGRFAEELPLEEQMLTTMKLARYASRQLKRYAKKIYEKYPQAPRPR